MTTLTAIQLFDKILTSIDSGGWQSLVVQQRKPFRIRAFRREGETLDLRIFIWNCTHGGGSARAKDEYRVQITGAVPSVGTDDTTLILGWHDGYRVFVAFDPLKHAGQMSQSPSIQIKEETLQSAHQHAFALYARQNGEIAIAFRPEFLMDYALNAKSLHKTGKMAGDLRLLNQVDTLTDAQIEKIKNFDRKTVVVQITKKVRAADFSRRVLGAYGHRCAMCGVQLRLIDAAHIVPVAATASTDETTNGIALCKLHHAAFDRNLVSFDEHYKIEVSNAEESQLKTDKRVDGIKQFRNTLKTAIILPYDRRDYPNPTYIRKARLLRRWIN